MTTRRTATGSRHIDAALLLAALGCAVLILLVWWGAPVEWAEAVGKVIAAALLAVGGSSLRESVGKLGRGEGG